MKEYTYRKTFINKETLNNICVPTGKQWKSTESKRLNIIESGSSKVLFNKIIEAVNDASSLICLQSFLIQDTEIIDALVKAKKERNVTVFIMDCAESKLELAMKEEEEQGKKEDYKKMCNEKFRNNFVHRQAGHLHAKFILIDPKTNPKGFLFTGNFNEKPFFENPELGVELNEQQIKSLFEVYVYHFWEHTTHEQTKGKDFVSIKPTNKMKLPNTSHILINSPNQEISNLSSTLLKSIESAKKSIIMSTFGFDLDNSVSKALFEKLNNGIAVTIFCRPREKTIIRKIEKLAELGAQVICHQLIHAKSLIIDDSKGFIFTANFEKNSFTSSFEVGVSLNKKQLNDLLFIYNQWQDNFPMKYMNSIRVKDLDEYYTLKNSKKLIKVSNEKIDERTKEINTVSELLKHTKITPRSFNEKKYIYLLNLQFNTLNNEYKTISEIHPNLTLASFERTTSNGKKKKETIVKEEVLLIKSNIYESLLSVLEDPKYKNYKIFA